MEGGGLAGDGHGRLALAVQQDLKGQAQILLKIRTELELHGALLNAAGAVRILPEQIVLLAHGPKEPGEQPVGNADPVPAVVLVPGDERGHVRQVGRKIADVRGVDDVLERDFVVDRGQAGLVLPPPEKSHLKAAGLWVETQDQIVPAGFRLDLVAEKRAEGLAPVGAGLRRRGLAVVIRLQAAEKLEGGGGHVPAGPGKRVGTIAQVAGRFLVQGQGELGAVNLKILALNAAFHFPEGLPLFEGNLLHAALAEQIAGGIDYIFGHGVVNELLQYLFDQTLVHAFPPETARSSARSVSLSFRMAKHGNRQRHSVHYAKI